MADERGVMARKQPDRRERVFFRMIFRSADPQVTEDDVAYFREHPDEIDEVTAPVKEALGPNADYWQTAENSRMR